MLPNGAAPAHAREWLRNMLSGFGPSSELLEDTIIVVDELVTNAVVHAGNAHRGGAGVLAGPMSLLGHRPVRRRPAAASRRACGWHGPRLRLVRAIATAWGVERTAAGTTVWAEIGNYASGTVSAASAAVGVSGPPGTRTLNLRVKSPMLCQLS